MPRCSSLAVEFGLMFSTVTSCLLHLKLLRPFLFLSAKRSAKGAYQRAELLEEQDPLHAGEQQILDISSLPSPTSRLGRG